MLLVASSLALLVIYAGVKLLIQVKREVLGNLYKFAAWFFIIAGLVILKCIIICSIVMLCKHGGSMMHKNHKKFGDKNHYKMESYKGHRKMMKYHHKGHFDDSFYINHCNNEPKCCSASEVCKMDTLKAK